MPRKIEDVLTPPPPPGQGAILKVLTKAAENGQAYSLSDIIMALEYGTAGGEGVLAALGGVLLALAIDKFGDDETRKKRHDEIRTDLEALVAAGKVKSKDEFYWVER